MFDNRKGLLKGTTLVFDTKKYEIIEEIGRGASCIVYGAVYTDSIGLQHLVRIKECYPYHIGLQRDATDELIVSDAKKRQFEQAKSTFQTAYEKNVQIKNRLGLMNSTVDSSERYEKNNTLYTVVSCVEGVDYRRYEETCLREVFTYMKTLSLLIQKYHRYGLLHLDIKPENILIIPETAEHIFLFDFDSLISKQELKTNSTLRLAYSNGFSAPELVRGRKTQICEATDIYSIGAIVFQKVFGHTPTAMDCSVSTTYDFSKMHLKDERYQPKFYQVLSDFLHKTISSSVSYRYSKIEQVIKQLEELEQLSDVNAVYLRNNFTYNSANFVGREDDLRALEEAMDKNAVVFLSGIGGIGKTELAKKYAWEYRNKYNNIVFVSFQHSIFETICSDNISIHNFKQEDGEKEEAFFERKLEVLKSVCTEDDLIILDNFDVEWDDHLEDLLECKCKFLITTREDYSDFNYKQIEVEPFHTMDELIELFEIYNPFAYVNAEMDYIQKIINFVERHTMTVELIAKYLRMTEELPSDLYERMLELEGVTSTDDTGVRHRKDKKLRKQSVDKHLQTLFDLSKFSLGEQELIMSLSLLGYVRIRKELFLEYCDMKNKQEELDRLIRRGWIEWNDEKISLHQIILDLVYNHMNPTSEKCPHIVVAMTKYAKEKHANWTEREVKRKLLKLFAKRIKGNDLNLARFLVEYSSITSNNKQYLRMAEKICNQGILDEEVTELMRTIFLQKIRVMGECEDMFDSELESEDYFNEQAEKIESLARSAYEYANFFPETNRVMGKYLLALAFQLDEVVSHNEYLGGEEGFDRLLAYANDLLQEAEVYLLQAEDMEVEEKIKAFEKIKEFYAEDDFCAFYRSEHFGSPEKGVYYQEIIEELKRPQNQKNQPLELQDVGCYDIAQKAVSEDDYDKAIAYFYKALEADERTYEAILYEIAEVYQKQGDTTKAMKTLEEILAEDKKRIEQTKEYFWYSKYVCRKLVELFIEYGDIEKAKQKLAELLWYAKKEESENSDWFVYVNYTLYKLERDETLREQYWNQCVHYYKEETAKNRMSEEIMDFMLDYIPTITPTKERIHYAFEMVEKLKESYEEEWNCNILSLIVKECEENECYAKEYILALVKLAKVQPWYQDDKVQQGIQYCQKALQRYESANINDEYLKSYLYSVMAELSSHCGDIGLEEIEDMQKKCNYYLLAEKHAEGKNAEDSVKVWEDALDAYSSLENWDMAEQCTEEIFDLLDYNILENHWYILRKSLNTFVKQNKKAQVMNYSRKILDKIMCYQEEYCHEENWEEKADDLSETLRDIAEIWTEVGYQNEAVHLYGKAVICRSCHRVEKELRKENFSQAIRKVMTLKEIDAITDVLEKMEKVECKEYQEEIQWFFRTYKYADVEFKK